MVDTWVGQLIRTVENMGLMEETAIIFTSDHGFYFGEHDGLFGKMVYAKRPDGTLYRDREPDSQWDHSPLYQELVALPLLVYHPEVDAGQSAGLSSAIEVMPTVLEVLGQQVPDWVEGRSQLSAMADPTAEGREYVISTIPFANPGDRVRSVDDVSRPLTAGLVTTITAGEWSLLFSTEPGLSELYHLPSDPGQQANLIQREADTARELHRHLLRFMEDTDVAPDLVGPRRELRL